MDLQQLRTFYMVAKAGSFSKAVSQLNLSQPAISRQVMLLEETLKTRLFNRHARKGLVLTAEGETLLVKTKDILRDIESLKMSLKEYHEPHGKLKIATTHTYASTWLMPHIILFMSQYPTLNIQLICHEEQMDLTLREADLYIGGYNHNLIGHEQELLFNKHLKLYASSEYLQNRGVPKTPSDLHQHRLLNYAYHRDYYNHFNCEWILELGVFKGGPPREAFLTVNSIESLVMATKAGLGIAPFIEGIKLIEQEGLINILPEEKSSPIGIHCSYLEQAKNHINIKTFIDFLKKEVRAHPS